MSWSCPVHGPSRVKAGKFGPYCATKLADGSWCTERPPKSAAVQAAAVPAAGTTGAPSSQGTSQAVLQAAALNFAASLCRGAGPEMADIALEIAVKAIRTMKAVGS